MGCDMVVLRYAILTGIPRVDGLSMGPPGFGASQFKNFWIHLNWSSFIRNWFFRRKKFSYGKETICCFLFQKAFGIKEHN